MAKKLKIGGHSVVNTLSVEIGEETYSIPLAGSMKRKELSAMKKAAMAGNDLEAEEAIYQIIAKFIPEDVLDDLTMDEYGKIVQAWSDANQEASRANLGES